MKKVVLVFIMMSFFSNAQVTYDSIGKNVFVNQVYEVSGSKTEIAKRAKEWVAKTYNNSNYVTRLDNDDKTILKGSFSINYNIIDGLGRKIPAEAKATYTLELAYKEGRCKINIEDVAFSDFEFSPWQLNHPTAGEYLYNKEEYKESLLLRAESQKGIYKRNLQAQASKPKKFEKQYKRYSIRSKDVLSVVDYNLSIIALSFKKTMLSEQDEDW